MEKTTLLDLKLNKIMETKIYHFEDWLIWLNKKQILIDTEHMDFEEHYQNLLTFENNYKNFKNLNK